MKRLLPLLISAPLLAASAQEQPKTVPTEIQDARKVAKQRQQERRTTPVVEAERAFARMSVEKGARAAFLANLARDGVIFRPGPVGGLQWFEDQPEQAGSLSWEPAYIEVAGSGEFGFSTGPFRYTPPAAGDQAPASSFGHFVTVWQRRVAGWKVVIDHGIFHGELPEKPELVARATSTRGIKEKTMVDARALMFTEMQIGAIESRDALLAGYETVAADDIRIYRDGSFPLQGKKNVIPRLTEMLYLKESEISGANMARSGDLAYTYGVGRAGALAHHAGVPAGFLHVWRKNAEDSWELVLDLLSPYPPPPAPEPPPAPQPVPAPEPGG